MVCCSTSEPESYNKPYNDRKLLGRAVQFCGYFSQIHK